MSHVEQTCFKPRRAQTGKRPDLNRNRSIHINIATQIQRNPIRTIPTQSSPVQPHRTQSHRIHTVMDPPAKAAAPPGEGLGFACFTRNCDRTFFSFAEPEEKIEQETH